MRYGRGTVNNVGKSRAISLTAIFMSTVHSFVSCLDNPVWFTANHVKFSEDC
jgi:hypothetical protein